MSLPNKNDYDTLGGEKDNYEEVTDPSTDLSAEASNETRADVAAMTRTAIRAWVGFTVNGTDVEVSNTDFDAVYGNAIAYKPTGVRNGVGDYTFTFPEEIEDARGNTISLNLQCGFGNCEEPGFVVNIVKLTANTFRVYNYSISDGAPADSSNKTFLFVL